MNDKPQGTMVVYEYWANKIMERANLFSLIIPQNYN